MSEPKTINGIINFLDTIKVCGSEEPHTEFNVAIIFRTLFLIDAFHDCTNTTRTKLDIPKTKELAKHILLSFKNDLLRIIKLNPKIDKDFFEDLLKNDLSIPNFKIYKPPLPKFNKDFNLLSNDKSIIDRIFNNLSQDNNTASLLQGKLNPKKQTIGIFPHPAPSFISSKFINNSDTGVDIILNKFTGKIQSNSTIYDYSTQPLYIFNYNENDLIFEFTDNESKVLLCVLHIFLKLCVITPNLKSETAAPAALELFTKKLMTLLGFSLEFRLNKHGYTPWGFIHNIYCSKLNSDLKESPCNTKTNTNHYPNIRLTIDSESSHASKDYLTIQLEKFFKNKSNLQEVEETKKAIIDLNQAIEDYNKIKKKNPDEKDENDSFGYLLEYAYTQILPEESSSFVLTRTTATNFDAAPSGNLSKTISRLSKVDGTLFKFKGIINENSENYIYNIKVTSGKIPILDFKYTPEPLNKCKLTLTNWFGSKCDKTHETTNSSEGTENGYSLSKAIANFKESENILDIHFKTLSDSGQAFCFYALQKFEALPHFVYIFHTLDTFCGAISSIINPGTIIERTDQIKQDAKFGDEEFIKSIYSTYNHVYCSKKTLAKANKNIKHFQNYDYFNENLKLVLELVSTKKKLDAETLRASQERQGKEDETKRADDAVIAKEIAETALYDRTLNDAQRIFKEQTRKLTKQIREKQDETDKDDIDQLLFNASKFNPLQTKVESSRTKLFGSPKRSPKKPTRRRRKRTSSSSSSSESNRRKSRRREKYTSSSSSESDRRKTRRRIRRKRESSSSSSSKSQQEKHRRKK
jgi:hypothetical protein